MDQQLSLWIVVGAIIAIDLVLVAWIIVAAGAMRRLAASADSRWSALAESLDRRRTVAEPLLSSADEAQRSAVADAFGRLESASQPEAKAAAETAVQQALRPLVQAAGMQPADSAAAQARAELAALDDEVQARRRDYNTRVRELNAKGRRFPTSFFRRWAGVPREYFEVDHAGAVAEPPRVQF